MLKFLFHINICLARYVSSTFASVRGNWFKEARFLIQSDEEMSRLERSRSAMASQVQLTVTRFMLHFFFFSYSSRGPWNEENCEIIVAGARSCRKCRYDLHENEVLFIVFALYIVASP